MQLRAISGLIAAAILASAASAQVPRGFTPQGADQRNLESNTALSARHYQDGVEAIQAKNFQVAEGVFQEVLRQNPNHADVRPARPRPEKFPRCNVGGDDLGSSYWTGASKGPTWRQGRRQTPPEPQ